MFTLFVHTHPPQWTDGAASCRFYRTPDSVATANTSCHDEVDFSLCFEDTAILYGICATFWLLSGFSFFRGNGLKPRLDLGLLHASKLVFCTLTKVPRRLGIYPHTLHYRSFCWFLSWQGSVTSSSPSTKTRGGEWLIFNTLPPLSLLQAWWIRSTQIIFMVDQLLIFFSCVFDRWCVPWWSTTIVYGVNVPLA